MSAVRTGVRAYMDATPLTGVLHSGRISTAEVIVSSDKSIKMVNSKLGNEMSKVNFFVPRSCHVDQLTFHNDHLCQKKKYVSIRA